MNNTIKQLDRTDSYQTPHPTREEYTWAIQQDKLQSILYKKSPHILEGSK